MSTARELGDALAGAFLAGVWNEERLVARGAQCLASRPRWLRPVARRVLEAYRAPPLDRPRELGGFVAALVAALPASAARPRVVRRFTVPVRMVRRPFPGAPRLDGVADLAALLGEDVGHLLWLADARGLERTERREALRHYRYRWRRRDDGRVRVLEAPKDRLKAAQRTLLDELLVRVPPHDAAHGFVRGRSALSHASAHVGRRVVVGFDLEDFFAAVPAGRVFATYRTAGYPEPVAHALTALATNVVPAHVRAALPRPRRADRIGAHHRLGRRLAVPHLPQGAPTSPALANLAAHGLDRRLAALAAAFGGATYTTYADDHAFSGGPEQLRRAPDLRAAVAEVVAGEGFALNRAKSRLMTDAGRQRVCGIVVNARPNVARREYDRLKALLHAAALDGPGDHDRDRVVGQVAWVAALHPGHGAKLRERLQRIEWPDRDEPGAGRGS